MSNPCFPVVKSLASTAALAEMLEAAYGLRGAYCQLIQATMRDVYLVNSQQKSYILFIYRHDQRTPAEITAEWSFIDYLHTRGAAVAPAVHQHTGELILTLAAPEGRRYAVLSTFVEGQHLRHRFSIEAARRYGHGIGQIHARSDTMSDNFTRPCNDFHCIVEQSLAALSPLLSHRAADMHYLREVAAIIQPKFNELPLAPPYYGMIHGDVIRANAQVADDGNVTILDFDLCGLGWRAYDVASYLAVAGTDVAKQAFIQGYQEARKLSDNELDSLPVFEAARHIFSLGVPALNVHYWGRMSISDTMIDASLDSLKQCVAGLR